MSVWANFADIYLRGMRDKSMRCGTELVRAIQLITDWSTAGNLSNPTSGVLRYIKEWAGQCKTSRGGLSGKPCAQKPSNQNKTSLVNGVVTMASNHLTK